MVSIDMAHALHPNYSAKHDATMAPKINGGLVIKHNADQRYATNAISASMFRSFGKEASVPVQEFSVKSDSGCGSTIGPIIATLSGILTVDCGSPQFSMHSIRLECICVWLNMFVFFRVRDCVSFYHSLHLTVYVTRNL